MTVLGVHGNVSDSVVLVINVQTSSLVIRLQIQIVSLVLVLITQSKRVSIGSFSFS